MATTNSIHETFQRTGHTVRGCPECGFTEYDSADDAAVSDSRKWFRRHVDHDFPDHHPFLHVEHHEIIRTEQT